MMSIRSLRTEKLSIWIPFGIPLKQGQTMYSNGTKTEKAGKKNGTQIKNLTQSGAISGDQNSVAISGFRLYGK